MHDIGRHEGLYFLTMELLEGRAFALGMRIRSEKGEMAPVNVVILIAMQVLDALPTHGVLVHRDIKPEMLWLAR